MTTSWHTEEDEENEVEDGKGVDGTRKKPKTSTQRLLPSSPTKHCPYLDLAPDERYPSRRKCLSRLYSTGTFSLKGASRQAFPLQGCTAEHRTALHSTARLNGIVGLAWLGWVLVDDGGTQSMTGRLLTAIHAA